MMSPSTQPPYPAIQTSSFVKVSTDCSNFSSENYTGEEQDFPGNITTASSFELPPFSDAYGYMSWGIGMSILLFGIVGNILVFIMMTDTKLKFLSYSVYLQFLAVSDSFLLLTGLIRDGRKTLSMQDLIQLQNVLCNPLFISTILASILSPWLMAGLTLDRYVCVHFPLTRDKLCTRFKAIVVCSTILGMSVILTVPFLANAGLVKDQCMPPEAVKYYFIFIRLVFSSTVPCMIILLLNILIIIRINRSSKFRNTFSTDSTNRQQDQATRSLVLVSVLAFVTLLPVTVSGAVGISLEILKTDYNALVLSKKLWPILLMIYILNFAQNFYILIGSSSNYRNIIRRKLAACCERRNRRNVLTEAKRSSIPPHSGASRSGLSLHSMTSGNRRSD